MDMGLAGKAAFVTGGSAGIGRAIVDTLAREGCEVAFTYYSQASTAEEMATALRVDGRRAEAIRMDVTSPGAVVAAAEAAEKALGRVDILVNNAVAWDLAFGGTNPDPALHQWQHSIRANLESHMLCTAVLMEGMKARGWGRVLNVSSDLAEDGLLGSASYSAAKAGLHGFTRGLCWELGPHNVLINVIMPGLTDTKHQRTNVPQSVFDGVKSTSPTGRITTPQDVADLAVFLCSERNANITGEFIRVAGGR